MDKYMILTQKNKTFIINERIEKESDKYLNSDDELDLIMISEIVIDNKNGTVVKNRYGRHFEK